jgi:hypothetical protein
VDSAAKCRARELLYGIWWVTRPIRSLSVACQRVLNCRTIYRSVHFVTILNPVSLIMFVVHFWVELTACKWPFCYQILLQAFSYQMEKL